MSFDQRRMVALAMTAEERDCFLRTERTCRAATVGADGRPHVTPVWFVWDGMAVWLYSLTRSQRWANLERDPRVAVAVDSGDEYNDLRGVDIEGRAEVVGPVPRTGDEDAPELAEPERLFALKYFRADHVFDGRHAWLRIHPEKITSWDFRKISQLRSRHAN